MDVLANIVDRIMRGPEGGVRTSDSKFSPTAIEADCPRYRGDAILKTYNGYFDKSVGKIQANKFLNSALYQSFDIAIDPSIQTSPKYWKKFACPQVLQLDDQANGFVFVGDLDTGINFTQVKSPAHYNVLDNAGLISLNEVYYYQVGDFIFVRGNVGLKSFHVDGILADPTALSTFDVENDSYPVSQDILNLMVKLAWIELFPEAAKPADSVNDSAETTELRAIKSNLV